MNASRKAPSVGAKRTSANGLVRPTIDSSALERGDSDGFRWPLIFALKPEQSRAVKIASANQQALAVHQSQIGAAPLIVRTIFSIAACAEE